MIEGQVYLLAAGNGRRSAGPKAWRGFKGSTLLERQIEFLLKLFKPEAVAVSIQEGWRARCLKIHPQVRWVAEDPEASPLGALQALVKAFPIERWAFLYHVDMPVWEPELFMSLARRVPSAESAGFEALAPSYSGRKGHPVLLSPALGPMIAALDPSKDRLDYWLKTRKEDAVEVPFGCIHENWNQPAA